MRHVLFGEYLMNAAAMPEPKQNDGWLADWLTDLADLPSMRLCAAPYSGSSTNW